MEPSDRLASDQNVTQFVQSFITKVVQDIEVAFNPAHTQSLDDGAFDLAVAPINSAATDGSLVEDKDMLDVKYWDVNMLAGSVADPAKTLGGDGKVVTVKAGATAAIGLPSAAVTTVPAGSSANGGGNPAGAMAGGGVIIPDVDPEKEGESEVKITNKLRRDAFLVFRALCKLSMKAPPAEGVVDPFAVRGKVVSLELLKICLENSGAVFRTNERFVGAVKQYLCLSLLKNCTSSLMSVFQLSCSIFFSLLTRFRSVLKAEIGVFFPMIVLRVLENVAHANFQQKMIVLRFLERLCVDPQILVDIFANYDCDVESTVSIFERMVSGLLKTAQGVPPGADSTLNAAQDQQLRLAAIKCMVGVLRSMGSWTNRQLCVTAGPKVAAEIGAAAAAAAASAAATAAAAAAAAAGEGPAPVAVPDLLSGDLLPDFVNPRTGVLPVAKSEEALEEEALGGMPAAGVSSGNEISEASILEQRRAYKLELQEGINLFNKKPKKGIDFLIKAKKLGDGAEEIVAFLRKTEGLDKTMIGDFLGDRDDMSIKIMHAYMDSYNLSGMDFDEAIRAVLLGFRLPGEAQKIDRIMEKFAERYCRCNPKAFTSADTAYVLAYSVIMLNTDAHNPGVKTKMSKADFLKNNRGIDDGKDIPEEFLGGLYDRITRNEIKMKPEILGPGGVASKAAVSSAAGNALLGLESILNLMSGRTRATTELETSDEVVRHMQEQFRAKAGKSGSVFYAASDVQIIRPMVDVVWAPMLAAFSVPLETTEEDAVTEQCLEGFRYAVHVTAVIGMQMQRDAFVTSLAKFTSLHSAADIKQKNVDAIKVRGGFVQSLLLVAEDDGNYLQDAWEHVLTCYCVPLPFSVSAPQPPFPFFQSLLLVAEDDGNYLQDSWEHVLTCVSRYEHLHLIGEGAPTDSHFFSAAPQLPPLTQQQRPQPLDPQGKRGGGRGVAASVYGGGGGHGVGGASWEAQPGEQAGGTRVIKLLTHLNLPVFPPSLPSPPRSYRVSGKLNQVEKLVRRGSYWMTQHSFSCFHPPLPAGLLPPCPPQHPDVSGKMNQVEKLVRRGSYDPQGVITGGPTGVGVGVSLSHLSPDQVQLLVANLGLLEQVGSDEVSRLFSRSERLNGQAIVEFVKALCKVSLEELRSPTEPRVFSLTKIVEIAHFNMSRIRLVWSRIWAVLADYFVTVGCMPNLSVAMYAIDSLRQLAMKFLEREELSNYNFQNEFLKPFVVVMRRTASVEIRELIIRCVSQMVFARVGNVKSGWKIMFMVFTTAATDDNKNIVLLAFETIEKVVREYFPYITETETTTFTDCVNCLIAFTNSRFNKDVSLNAIAFLRFCALKLAEGDLGATALEREKGLSPTKVSHLPGHPDGEVFTDKDDHLYFWFPLLAGLSELTFDPRPDIRKRSSSTGLTTLQPHPSSYPSTPGLSELTFDPRPDIRKSASLTLCASTATCSPPSSGSASSSPSSSPSLITLAAHPNPSTASPACLSELTFDPRPDIRKSALEVLFDTLHFHGHMFSSPPLFLVPSLPCNPHPHQVCLSELTFDPRPDIRKSALEVLFDTLHFLPAFCPLSTPGLSELTFDPRPDIRKSALEVLFDTPQEKSHSHFHAPISLPPVPYSPRAPSTPGLSELTFDPRPDIRKSALEVLFDTLRFHGHMFSAALWERVFESVLFPIFDYVRRASEPQHGETGGMMLGAKRGGGGGGGGRERGGKAGKGEAGGVGGGGKGAEGAGADGVPIHKHSHHKGAPLSRHPSTSEDERLRAARSGSPDPVSELEMDAWLYETCTLALQLVVDLFVKFYSKVSPLLGKILALLTSFIRRPHQSLAAIGVAAFVRLMSNAGGLFSEEKWDEVLTALKETTGTTLPDLAGVVKAADLEDEEEREIERQQQIKEARRFDFTRDEDEEEKKQQHDQLAAAVAEAVGAAAGGGGGADGGGDGDGGEEGGVEAKRPMTLAEAVADVRCKIAVQLLLVQVSLLIAVQLLLVQAMTEIFSMHGAALSAPHTLILLDSLHRVGTHAHAINSDRLLRSRLQALHLATQMPDPPLLRLESEALHAYLSLLQRLPREKAQLAKEVDVELRLVILCEEVLRVYVGTSQGKLALMTEDPRGADALPLPPIPLAVPLGSARRRELVARAPLVVATLQAVTALKDAAFKKHLARFFPLLADLVSSEHGSPEIQVALSNMFSSRIGPIVFSVAE
ncbi:unnamed protein product [Closterium sp. Naga37s-1]|nr:unnamed protein product [Closterium sp. Naga37s-1]